MINVSFLLKKYYRFKSSLQKKLYICPVFNDIDHEWRTSSVRTMSIYNDKNYIDNVINLNLIKKQSKMTKNESKLLSIQGIAKASAFCLLLSAFSVNAAMAAPAPAGTVDEVMAVQQGKKVTGVVVDGTGEPVIGANVVVKGTTNGTITDFDGNYTIEGVPADGVLVISYIGYLSQEIPVGNQSAINVTLKEDTQTLDEVVVVGYGTMRKSDVTGSISTAKGEEMLKAQNFSALDTLDCWILLEKLYRLFSIERLMIAGGGLMNWSFVQEDLLDELSIVMAPVADGSTRAVSIFEKADFLPARSPAVFKLKEAKTLDGDTLWLRYTRR